MRRSGYLKRFPYKSQVQQSTQHLDHEIVDTHTNIFTMGLTERYTNYKLPHVDEKVVLETLHIRIDILTIFKWCPSSM